MKDACVATLVFQRRCAQVGDRLCKFVSRGGLTPSGHLDMRRAGCFDLEFDSESGLCTKVVHISLRRMRL